MGRLRPGAHASRRQVSARSTLAVRIQEIGLRLALGATTHDIRLTVIREALVTAAAGLVVGVPCAFVSRPLVASSLTLVSSHAALAFGGGMSPL